MFIKLMFFKLSFGQSQGRNDTDTTNTNEPGNHLAILIFSQQAEAEASKSSSSSNHRGTPAGRQMALLSCRLQYFIILSFCCRW